MKIGPVDTKPVTATATLDRKAGAAPIKTDAAEPSAQVALSSTATEISDTGSDATFDTAKVERISQAIRDGKFKIDPEAIADKLLQNTEELMGRKLSN